MHYRRKKYKFNQLLSIKHIHKTVKTGYFLQSSNLYNE